jgi:hypothetical protein
VEFVASAADGGRLGLITDVGKFQGTQKTARVSNNGPGFSQGLQQQQKRREEEKL